MKNVLLSVVVLAMVLTVSSSSMAGGKMMWGIGGDVLLPIGTFGDRSSVGFGGTARFEYMIDPMFSVTGTAGYYTWTGKKVAGVTLPDFHGVIVKVGGKYYFMPEGGTRFYGIVELGMLFSSVSATIGGVSVSASSSDLAYEPGVGVQLPLGSGNSNLDVSIGYLGVATTGSSSGSVAARVGVNFGLGN